MPVKIEKPRRIEAAATKPKIIDEFIGNVNTKTSGHSIAHMRSPSGWLEPGQTPEFDEYTIVLRGALHIEYAGGEMDIRPGEAVHTKKGEWVRYSTPGADGAEYIAICIPAFTPGTVHRDED